MHIPMHKIPEAARQTREVRVEPPGGLGPVGPDVRGGCGAGLLADPLRRSPGSVGNSPFGGRPLSHGPMGLSQRGTRFGTVLKDRQPT